VPGCAVSGRALVALQGNGTDPSKQKLKWQWSKGTASMTDFGDPIGGTTDYLLCLYDDDALRASAAVSASDTCNGKSCWTGTKTGLVYKNAHGNDTGITQLVLKSGIGNAKVTMQGKGAGLTLPFPITDAVGVKVQLVKDVDSGTACWEAEFPAPATVNDPSKRIFKDKTS
jgi:hypothetical protein